MWAAAASGMPAPLSPISTRTRSPSRAVRTVSRPVPSMPHGVDGVVDQLVLAVGGLQGTAARGRPGQLVPQAGSATRAGCESVPSVLAALLAAPVTAHHAQSEPHQRPEQRRGHREEPKRPGETPEQEVEPDALGVLDHEDDQQPHAGERGNRPTAEPARPTPKILVACIQASPSHRVTRLPLDLDPNSSRIAAQECVLRPLCAGDTLPGAASKETTVECCRRSKPVSWAWLDLNQRPHPYQLNAGNRCAAGRSRRSRPTVGAKCYAFNPRTGMRSTSAS